MAGHCGGVYLVYRWWLRFSQPALFSQPRGDKKIALGRGHCRQLLAGAGRYRSTENRPDQRALFRLVEFLREDLLAAASRREFLAVSADGPAEYRIPDTSAGGESAGDLPEFLIIQKAGANPAKHTVCFHK